MLIINWWGRESRDPWYTGGAAPAVPAHCSDDLPAPPTGTPGNLNPPPDPVAPPNLADEGCQADNPGTTSCSYDAKVQGGVSGYGADPGGWKVTIARPGLDGPIVIRGFGGPEIYACGTVKPGDHVVMTVKDGAHAFAGNNGICY